MDVMKIESFWWPKCLNIGALLCALWGIFASCETEDLFYQSRFSKNDIPLTREMSFDSSSFFAYADSDWETVASALREVEGQNHFVASFLQKYGVPLWNFAYSLTEEEETCIFVPLFHINKPRSIESLWLLRIKDRRMKFFPLRRDDEAMKQSNQVFIFDLLSYMVFAEKNKQGIIFKPHEQTRGFLTFIKCWDVYTGTEGNLTYSYTNCIEHSYFVDDELFNRAVDGSANGGASGEVFLGGGGGGSSSEGSASVLHSEEIFKKEEDSDAILWQVIENMIGRIMEDCLGSSLYSALEEKLDKYKINLEFNFSEEYSYECESRTLKVGLANLESNCLMHEMFHALQTLQEPISSFKNAKMNREIETHYAQYLFLKRSVEWTDEKKDKFTKNQRWRAVMSLDRFVNNQGNFIEDNLFFYDTYLSNNVVSSFRKDGYESYPFDESEVLTTMFDNIKSITKNCEP